MVTRFRSGSRPKSPPDRLAGEEPLEIRVNGTPLAVTMRTPGSDYELAAGFLVFGRGDLEGSRFRWRHLLPWRFGVRGGERIQRAQRCCSGPGGATFSRG